MESRELVSVTLDKIRRASPKGVEYWMARDLQVPLGYAKWSDFVSVIEKARMSCESMGVEPANHFAETSKMANIGSGAKRPVVDLFLSRYAAYLIAMNGNPQLPEIAAAQSYFAVQTRRQELSDQFGSDVSKRIELRERVKDANKHLTDAAKDSGVQNYALFHEAGYRGLYGMGLSEIKQKKGINAKENLLDRSGRAELAANEFRITQAEGMLRRTNIKGDKNARNVHEKVGKAVRDTIKNLGGTMPEDLASELPIKLLARQVKEQQALPDDSGKEEQKK